MNVETSLPITVRTAHASTRHLVTTRANATTAIADDSVKMVRTRGHMTPAYPNVERTSHFYGDLKQCNVLHAIISPTASIIDGVLL